MLKKNMFANSKKEAERTYTPKKGDNKSGVKKATSSQKKRLASSTSK